MSRIYDLREDEDRQRESDGERSDPGLTEQILGGRAREGRARGVRDRVQREDRRDRLVDVVLYALEPHTGPLPSLLEHRNVRMRDREEDRFQDRAEERDPEA